MVCIQKRPWRQRPYPVGGEFSMSHGGHRDIIYQPTTSITKLYCISVKHTHTHTHTRLVDDVGYKVIVLHTRDTVKPKTLCCIYAGTLRLSLYRAKI